MEEGELAVPLCNVAVRASTESGKLGELLQKSGAISRERAGHKTDQKRTRMKGLKAEREEKKKKDEMNYLIMNLNSRPANLCQSVGALSAYMERLT